MSFNLFDIIGNSIAILLLLVGSIGYLIVRKKHNSNIDPEYTARVYEQEREEERRAREEKELDDFMTDANSDYY